MENTYCTYEGAQIYYKLTKDIKKIQLFQLFKNNVSLLEKTNMRDLDSNK